MFPACRHLCPFLRSYSSKQRGRLLDLQLIDPYIPPPLTFPTSRQSLTLLWQRIKKSTQFTIGLGMLKYSLKFNSKKFALETEQKYIEMNRNAYGNKDFAHLVTDGFYHKLKGDLKAAAALGRVEYKYIETEQQPKLVHMCQAKADVGEGKELKIFQCTVRLKIKQSLAIYSKVGNKLIGGDPKGKSTTEYVVMERWPEKEKDDWKIKGIIDKSN